MRELLGDGRELRPGLAGLHIFTVSGKNQAGTSGGTTASTPVLVSYGPNEGHAILIGMDFAVSNASADSILHKAVEQVPWRHQQTFDRKVRVTAFRQATVDDVEAAHAQAAIADLVDSAAYQEVTDAANVTATLTGSDVFLVYDQQDPDNIAAIGAALEPTLRGFLDAGGVVIVLDGLDALSEGGTGASATFRILAQPAGEDGPLLQIGADEDFRQFGQRYLFPLQDDIPYVTQEAGRRRRSRSICRR